MFPLMSHKSNSHESGRIIGGYGTVAVRVARPEDEAAIRRIAALDDRAVPRGHVLVAEVDGDVIAAVSVGGIAVADPFRWTSDVVALLQMRADQLQAGEWAPYTATAGAVRAFPRTV